MIDFQTQLYASRRAYINEIDTDKFVFFSPDNEGLPFVGRQKVKEVFDRYEEGQSVLEVLQQEDTEQQNAVLQITKYLFEKGLLRQSPTPERYSASEFPNPDRIKS